MDKPLNVMVVDDDAVICETLREFFLALGDYEVFTAHDGYEAFDLLNKVEMDCIFVDFMMPGMSGLQFLEKVKTHDKSILVVVMTGYPSHDAIIEAMRKGASDFLTKPFKLDEIRIALERLARERSILKENIFLSEELKEKKALEDLNKRLEKKIREQSILFMIGDTLSKVHRTEELYQKIVEMACQLVDAEKSFFMLADMEKGEMVLIAAKGIDKEEYIGRWAAPLKGNMIGQVILEGVPLILKDIQKHGGPKLDFLPQGIKGTLITIPFKIRNETFGALTVTGKKTGDVFSEEDLFILFLLAEKSSLTVENLILYESVMLNLHATLRALVSTLEAKDPYTRSHSGRVTAYAIKIARALGLKQEEIDSIAFAGYLHDIGKIGIRDDILLKPGKLLAQEYDIIKKHPVIGENIVKHLGLLPKEKAIIRHHHERWDGKGYPDGLNGEDIPLLSRILAVADAYDALTSNRPYRKAKSRSEAIRILQENRFIQFDGQCVDMLVGILDEEGNTKEIKKGFKRRHMSIA
ncbi:MAG: response regulator [Desulfovibrionales bacterium]|nr:response regulator [Desulfovibrionales bacterium]